MRAIIQIMLNKPFNILKNNMLFIQPLLFYLLLLMTLLTFIVSPSVQFISKVMMIISIVLMTVAISAGWFYINKLALLSYNQEDDKETITEKSINNFKKFFIGVGENFFRFLFSNILCFIFFIGVIYLIFKACFYFFGEPTIFLSLSEMVETKTNAEIFAYLNSMPQTDKLSFVSWVWAMVVSTFVLNFFWVLYFTVLIFEKDNIFICFLKTLKFFFQNIFNFIFIIFITFILYFGLNFLSIITGTNTFWFVILIILMTLYLNYYLLLVLCFYNEKSKSNSNNRT